MLYPPKTIQRLLQDRNRSKVAQATGLATATVIQLANGKMNNPTADTLQKLTDYFEAQKNVENLDDCQ